MRDQLAVGAHEADRKVFVFINVGTESRARDIGIDLSRFMKVAWRARNCAARFTNIEEATAPGLISD